MAIRFPPHGYPVLTNAPEPIGKLTCIQLTHVCQPQRNHPQILEINISLPTTETLPLEMINSRTQHVSINHMSNCLSHGLPSHAVTNHITSYLMIKWKFLAHSILAVILQPIRK